MKQTAHFMKATLDYINLYQCEKGFATGERVFDFPYLLYVHKGKGQYKLGGVWYECNMGDMFFCPAGTGNTIAADADDPFLLSGVDFRLQASGPPPAIAPSLNILADSFLVSLINRMISEYALGRVRSRDICDAFLTALILELQRLSDTGKPGRGNTQAEMLEYLRGNTGRTVGGAELASAFSYHKSTINRIVTAATGMSPREYQIAARIRMAEELLAYSNRPMSEIATLCGYTSPIFFSRQFREKTGKTPGEYRRVRRNHNI